MPYHIQTEPIWEAFRADCDCPLCEIYNAASDRLVEQYLNEAVMEPDYRVQVNKYGFCTEHLRALFAGKNKLGLSLQLRTRTEEVRSHITPCASYRQALQQADALQKTMHTCVICNTVDDMMRRYAQTVAQLFADECDFRTVFGNSNGFCLPHYALLLRESNKAGRLTKAYLSQLVLLQNRTVDRICHDLDRFAERFDYRNAGSAVRPDPDTIPKAIRKLKGRILPRANG